MTTITKLTLTVHDLQKVSDFYQRAVGLRLLSADAATARLGTGTTTLLELRRDPAARMRSRREAGLFHTAFLLPTRGDLARWMRHAAQADIALQGASDHLVSEAIYLADPEGNGIEIYADRPPETWVWRDGMVEMRSDPLDLNVLIQTAGPEPWQGFPDAAIIGHVHLQVGALPEAEDFYAGTLSLPVTCRYPGATFFGANGYHHHIATNIWNSKGAGVRVEPVTGLAEVEIRGGKPGAALRDPWGTKIRLT